MDYVVAQGVRIPALGLGTYKLRGNEGLNSIKKALEIGYRHIDTAQMYNNEEEVGEAVRQSNVDREDVFITTKILRRNLEYGDVLSSVNDSLRRLGMEHVDLLLIHAPSSSVPIEESIEAMNELQDEGKVDHIGVSNFSVKQTQEAIEASETPVVTNQVKYHPFYSQNEILDFCIENDVMLTAYTPLANGRVIGHDTLSKIGEKYGKTGAQVALRWLVQQENVSTIPKASSEEHLRENIDIFDFELTRDEMQTIFDLQGGLIDRLRSRLGL
ncbi:MAG: aldo/keto reductase [Halobacteria archaeon]|nr:aldo/keto reductase [Halobacteria archaeon]